MCIRDRQCSKFGVVKSYDSCKKFVYSPLKRIPVSYTHLDVYKRQVEILSGLNEGDVVVLAESTGNGSSNTDNKNNNKEDNEDGDDDRKPWDSNKKPFEDM